MAAITDGCGCSGENNKWGFSKKIRNDLILIAVALLISLTSALFFFFTGDMGEHVAVIINGKEEARYSLSEDREVRIGYEGEEYYNLLVIKDGCAFVSEADCRDGICVSHRAISREGETIVCLPHRLVVEIVNE